MSRGTSPIGMITTNYFLTDNGAKKLREDLHSRSVIHEMINFNELKIFESALGQHNLITILSKGAKPEYVAQTCTTNRQGSANREILSKILAHEDDKTSYYQVSQSSLYDGLEFYIRLEGVVSNKTSHPEQDILKKIKDVGTPLNDMCNVNQGILSGIDKITKRHVSNKLVTSDYLNHGVYVISKAEFDKFNLSEHEREIVKPFFKKLRYKKI